MLISCPLHIHLTKPCGVKAWTQLQWKHLNCGFEFLDEKLFKNVSFMKKIASLPIRVVEYQVLTALEMLKARWKTWERYITTNHQCQTELTWPNNTVWNSSVSKNNRLISHYEGLLHWRNRLCYEDPSLTLVLGAVMRTKREWHQLDNGEKNYYDLRKCWQAGV